MLTVAATFDFNLRTCSLSLRLQVTVQVTDVNEPPSFAFAQYNASVVSIAAYKSTVIVVKVTAWETSSDLDRLVLSPFVRFQGLDSSRFL